METKLAVLRDLADPRGVWVADENTVSMFNSHFRHADPAMREQALDIVRTNRPHLLEKLAA
jgi:hypothetical protein